MNRAPAALALLAIPIIALAAPSQADDARIVEQFYDAGKVVRIEGRTKVQATIQFAQEEHIENVAIGDSSAWQVTPNKRANVLFVKPLATNAATNMTVVTDRHTYLFDLVASASARPLYVLRFTYPEEAEAPQMASAQQSASVEAAATNNPYAIVDPTKLNFAWRAKGDKKLHPQRIYDDGTATFLAWSAGQELPAVLVKDASGLEGPVNFASRDDMIVIDGVPREIVLRAGKDSASLVNAGPLPAPPAGPQSALARLNPLEGSR